MAPRCPLRLNVPSPIITPFPRRRKSPPKQTIPSLPAALAITLSPNSRLSGSRQPWTALTLWEPGKAVEDYRGPLAPYPPPAKSCCSANQPLLSCENHEPYGTCILSNLCRPKECLHIRCTA